MRVKFLPKLMQASLICCLALIFTGCEEFLNSLDNPVSSELKMDNSPVTLKVGESRTRTAKARTGAIVTYSSSNEAVATVDQNGTVTAVAEGTATITASVTGGTVQGTNIPFIQESVSYEVTVESAIDPLLATPLTLEVTSAGTIVVNSPKDGMQYSLNGGAKTAVPNGTAIGGGNLSVGDKVAFYGNGTTITNYNGTIIKNGTAHVKVYGNIMSLVDEENFPTAKELSGTKTFRSLFDSNKELTDASGLKLPATTLADRCYYWMFSGCTALTAAPKELPATTLADHCYYAMFQYCTSLTTAPALPATTLADYCYNAMFYNCDALTTAPELPATTLADYCYDSMFEDCAALTAAPKELPATTLAEKCYMSMFKDCDALTAAPKELPATTLASSCYLYMFQGCTSLTTAPELPATTLADYCYNSMFYDCTSLTTAYVKAAYTITNYECLNMFANCTATGAKLHTTSDNKASWDSMMGSGKTWATWTVDTDWTD